MPNLRPAPTIHQLVDYEEFCGIRGEEEPDYELDVPSITPRELKARLDKVDDLSCWMCANLTNTRFAISRDI